MSAILLVLAIRTVDETVTLQLIRNTKRLVSTIFAALEMRFHTRKLKTKKLYRIAKKKKKYKL